MTPSTGSNPLLEFLRLTVSSYAMPKDSTHFYNEAIDAVQAGQLENAISFTDSF